MFFVRNKYHSSSNENLVQRNSSTMRNIYGVVYIGCSMVLIWFFIDEVPPHNIPDGYKLEKIQVFFRHGDRIPELKEIYKTDPYNELYKKIGYGQLTEYGKRRSYQVGKILRQRYNNFVHNYSFTDVYAYTTDYNRTKISLKLALAGLYPLTNKNKCNEILHSSSIQINYDRNSENFLLSYYCPRYRSMVYGIEKLPEIHKKLKEYNKLYQYLENQTGLVINITSDSVLPVISLYQNIQTVISMNLKIPDWCTDDVYKKMEEITALYFDFLVYTNEMKRISVGPVMETILSNIKNDNDLPKVYLYCCHDINIGILTRSLNITGVPIVPDFGSSIIIEKLRGSDNGIYLRFFMWTGVTVTWIPLKIPACNDFICSLTVYENIIQSILPDEESRNCKISQTE